MGSIELQAAAQQALEALQNCANGEDDVLLTRDALAALRAALAEPVQEHDLSRCPKCNGPADNGHDRKVPPNPYVCTKCMAEPVAWRWGYRSVTTGEMDWRGYVEIPAHPNLRSPEIIMEPLYAAPPQRPAEPVQEPVLTVDALRVEFERRYRGKLGITRVEGGAYLSPAIETEWQQFVRKHTAPPQRKPLTEAEIDEVWNSLIATPDFSRVKIARAVERAHGIGGKE